MWRAIVFKNRSVLNVYLFCELRLQSWPSLFLEMKQFHGHELYVNLRDEKFEWKPVASWEKSQCIYARLSLPKKKDNFLYVRDNFQPHYLHEKFPSPLVIYYLYSYLCNNFPHGCRHLNNTSRKWRKKLRLASCMQHVYIYSRKAK